MHLHHRMYICTIKKETDYSSTDTNEEIAVLLYGMQLLKTLISSWLGSGHLVCVDSYFASIQAVDVMIQEGLKFIGIVKTTTRFFPINI